jgi:tetratricopeptide (TPR) repeat protein
MNARSILLPCCLLAGLAACAAVGDAAPAEPETGAGPASQAGGERAEGASGAPVEASCAQKVDDGEAPLRYGLSRDELAIWNDPAFRKAFTQSYVAETDIEPRVTPDELQAMEQILGYISSDRADKALKLLQKNTGPASSAVFDFTLANIHFQADELDEAAAAYETAVAKHPKFRRAWRNLGLIHVRQERFDEAVRSLARVIELGGGDALTYGLLGFAYAGVGNHLSAESAYRMAVLLDPATVDWKQGLALSLFKQGRFADAAALCGTLIAEHPDNAGFWLLQANAYIGLEQPLRAAENFELVDRLGGSTADSLASLGDIYANEELYDLAVDAYARALGKQGGVDRPLRAAKVMTAHGANDETRALLERIEALRGESLTDAQRKDLLKLRARLAVAEGAGEEEAKVLEEIVELDPLDGEALILLGQHASRAGDAEKAVFYYERAEGIEGSEADALVRHAQLLVGQGEYRDAIGLLRRAQNLKPRDNVQQYLEQVERVSQGR